MTDIHLSEFMELDSYWENAVKDAAENTIHSQRRLELALRNRKKINKILQNYKPVLKEMMRNGRESNENENEDDDEILTVSSCDDDPQPESMNQVDHEVNTQSGPSTKRKAKLALAKRNYLKEKNKSCFRDKSGLKIRKSNVEFAREPLHEGQENGKKTYSSGHCSKMNPYVLRKKRLAVLTAQIKRKKRNANMKKHEKRAKNMKMKGKSYKAKRPRRKMGQGSDNDEKRDGKQDQKSKNQETKVENSNADDVNGNANNEDGKKSAVAGKEMPVTKKISQSGGKNVSNVTGPTKTDKDNSKGHCSQDANPKENDIRYGSISDSEQSFRSVSFSSFGH